MGILSWFRGGRAAAAGRPGGSAAEDEPAADSPATAGGPPGTIKRPADASTRPVTARTRAAGHAVIPRQPTAEEAADSTAHDGAGR